MANGPEMRPARRGLAQRSHRRPRRSRRLWRCRRGYPQNGDTSTPRVCRAHRTTDPRFGGPPRRLCPAPIGTGIRRNHGTY
jgi:hypothetical protein